MPLLTYTDLAERLNVSTRHIRRLVRRYSDVVPIRKGYRTVRFTTQDANRLEKAYGRKAA